MKQKNIPTLCIALLLALGYLATYMYKAPKADFQDPDFNLESTISHLEEIAKDAHPIGTSEHKRVHDYIASEATKMGYNVQLDTLVDHQNYWGYHTITDIHNIIITKIGTNPKGTIAFAAHYDSQPNTPGAADDAAPIATMLSIMETIKDKSYENDIAFIITDGEETGLSGASLFTQLNPLAPKIEFLFNFEARGNSGPLLGFEPNTKNNFTMDMYLDLEYSMASSLMYDVYRLMPNDTDFTHFKKLDIGGISMAITEGFVNYHSMTDTPENIDKSSLYHYGKIITQLIDKLGNDSLEADHSYDMTYFNTIGYHSVQYKPIWNLILLILSILLFVLYIPLLESKKSFVKIIIGLFNTILFLALSLLCVFVISWILEIVYPHYKAFYSSNFYNAKEYFLGFIMIITLVFQLYGMLVKKDERINNLHLGGIIFIIIIGIFSYIYIPSGSYIIIVPLFSFLLLQQLRRFVSDKRTVWIDTLSAVVPVILIAPTVYLVYVIFSVGQAELAMILYAILMIYLMPIFKRSLRLWTMLILSLFLVSLIRGHTSSSITENQPYQANWTYVNSDDEEWIMQKDDVLDQVEKAYFPNSELVDRKYGVKKAMGLADPVTYKIEKDTINGAINIRFKTHKEVIRMRMWGQLLEEANEIEMRGKKFKLRETAKNSGIQFYGDIKSNDVVMKLKFDTLPKNGSFKLETVQRGLIDIIAKDKTIIPGTGYKGGTIIHCIDIGI